MTSDPPTVLVVDDEADVTEVYAMWLDDEYDVRTATGGVAALDEMDSRVDVVLLDRRMPDMTGDEVLETIRERGYDAKVAMVTAVDPDFDIVDVPFDAYLTKPVLPRQLNEVVAQMLVLDELEEETEGLREGYRLRETREALRAEKTSLELEESEEFERLTDRLESIRENVAELVDDIERRSHEEGPEWTEVPAGDDDGTGE